MLQCLPLGPASGPGNLVLRDGKRTHTKKEHTMRGMGGMGGMMAQAQRMQAKLQKVHPT